MHNKPNLKILTSAILFCFLFPVLLEGQSFRFKNYGADSKIPDGFVYTLIQADNGYLWVGTASGIYRFDGFDYYNVAYPDTSQGKFTTCCLKDKNGVLWFGCNDGSVYYSDNDNLKQLSVPIPGPISAMLTGPDGLIYIFPQGKSIYRVNPLHIDEISKYSINNDIVVFSACFTLAGDLLIGTQEDVKVCSISADSLRIKRSIGVFDYSGVLAINRINDKEEYIIGTNGSGLFRMNLSDQGNTIVHLINQPEFDNLNVQSIFRDTEGCYWVSTNNSGILQFRLSPKDETVESLNLIDKRSGLAGNNVRLVYQDNDENYWIGLFGDGLSALNSLAFSFYSLGTTVQTKNIIYINKLNDNYFLGTPSGYYLFDLKHHKVVSYMDILSRTGNTEISSYCVDADKNIWIGTSGAGLFVRNPDGAVRSFYRSGNSAEDNISDIAVYKNNVWIGTLNGVRIIDRNTGRAGVNYNIDNGLPHNSINHICITLDGKAAVATKTDRLYLIDPEKGIIAGKALMHGARMNEIISISQSIDGPIWASTSGNGVFEFYGDSVRSVSRSNMLLSDYCYSILADSASSVWIGHERGFSRFFRKTGITKTYTTDFAGGGVCNPNGMYESPDGNVFIGTNEGLIVYERANDQKKHFMPHNNINYLTINDVVYPYQPSYTLPYNKRYSVVVSYTGINFSDPEKVYYRTRMDDYDNNWSKITLSREAKYMLSDGKYKFSMISMNEDGLSDNVPVSFDLVVRKPLVKTWGFILSSIAVIAGIIVIIIRRREKEQKKIQQYLEKELDARTSVVLKQKGELELQNIEITDSINYAKRIQTSILPDFNKVKEAFKDAFLIFRPRDIVSGDFYWFDKTGEDRVIIVCADSTGHGVPGAFMSMIGSTLLQDIVARQHIIRPSEILTRLDKQIFSTLNQNVELGVSNDGMDMVVCEINTKSRHIRFASAMRPVILVMGNEPYYIKGNRCSVGGESVIEKYFDDQEYYLNEGDTIYMFSDGLPDQFGGTDGKKMKIARLKKLIEDVSNLSLTGQKEVITKFYDEWKGEYEQVDDILLIGVRL
ncbi:MAG: two-component regulator propeller domain-containing protein [Bacteroidales bacterium]|jgi:ligand-binding sensor domain-containing protein/serine phosphatase RsbU (regulator of sigma subunit)